MPRAGGIHFSFTLNRRNTQSAEAYLIRASSFSIGSPLLSSTSLSCDGRLIEKPSFSAAFCLRSFKLDATMQRRLVRSAFQTFIGC